MTRLFASQCCALVQVEVWKGDIRDYKKQLIRNMKSNMLI